nr:DEAD/DEAH box helicase [Mycobacterium paragordonae]
MSASSAGYGLFAHQRDACQKSRRLLAQSPNRLVLHMPTGSGKTRTAMHLIADEFRQREPTLVIWLAYSDELCEQAASEFETAWTYLGDRQLTTYRFWGASSLQIDEVNDGFVVAGLAKMFSTAKVDANFLIRLADRCSLVVIDEAHQAIAESYRFLLEVLSQRNAGSRLLGLTATPGRTWNDPDKDQELADFFHRRKVTLQVTGYENPVDYLIEEGYLARPTFESLNYSGPSGPLSPEELSRLGDALDVPEDLLIQLAEDEQRNLLILNRTERLVAQHARTIVFAATVDHARTLATVLRARGILADAVTAATPPGERSRIIARFKSGGQDPRVLCNYGVLTTGFDAPRTSAALIARPTKSLVLYSQMVGRATRGLRAGGNETATIVTVVDRNLPGFGEMSEAFTNWEDVW